MEIDIRKNEKGTVKRIRFDESEPKDGAYYADVIYFYGGDCNVWLNKSSDRDAMLGIKNEEAARNLIAALNKAIELGWFDE